MDVNDIGIALLRGLFAGLPFGVALALGVILPVAVVGLASITGRLNPSTRALIILGSLVLGSALSIAFSGRTLYSDSEILRNPYLGLMSQTPSTLSIRISQLCTLVALLMSTAEIFRHIGERINISSPISKLWWSYVVFNFVSIGLAGFFGVFREPDLKYIYFFVLFSGLASIAAKIEIDLWRSVRWLLLVPTLGSLLCMVIAPQAVMLNDYEAFLPGIKSRLFGLSEHANGIGILAATALIIEFSSVVRASPSIFIVMAHGAVLVLSQSKTAWLALLIVLVVVRWDWITSTKAGSDGWRRGAWITIGAVSVTALGLLLLVMASSSVSLTRALEAKSVFTLTGRFRIWDLTIVEFIKSPMLGYGPSLWDLKFRMERAIPFAGQAHNQFVQILGQAGIMGLLSMLAYLVVLGRMAVRARENDKGLTLALYVLILIRCMVESPLRMFGVMGWENVLHMLVLTSAAMYGSKSYKAERIRTIYRHGLKAEPSRG